MTYPLKTRVNLLKWGVPFITSTLLFLSPAAHSLILDEEWGDWYGSTAMAWELNTQNDSGETLTLTCTNKAFRVQLKTPNSTEPVGSDNFIQGMQLRINDIAYDFFPSAFEDTVGPDKALFHALKQTKDTDTLQFTSLQIDSESFSAKGLAEALADTDYQDCVDHM
ncbi:hypothetical protein [Providencia sp.]|uniref:hypothetical protein n=1 Tax=Providencia sp. TaxID=589 RepID=UPI0035AE5DB6